MDFLKFCGVVLLILGYYIAITKIWMKFASRIGAFFGFSKWIEVFYRKKDE
jgi:hypothetical protein